MDKTSEGTGIVGVLTRQPLAALGAIALLSLAQDMVQLHSWIASWISAWRSVTYPIWEFLLGNLLGRFHLHSPLWLKDYFGIGLVVFGMNLRAQFFEQRVRSSPTTYWFLGPFPIFKFRKDNWFLMSLTTVLNIIEAIALWPGIVANRTFLALSGDMVYRKKLEVFVETLVWVLVLVAVSYGLK